MRLCRSFVGVLTGVIPFIGTFILGVVATVIIDVEHAGAVETYMQTCNEYLCPDGYRHPDMDQQNRFLACQPHPGRTGLWQCYEEQGSITSDGGKDAYTPKKNGWHNYTCFKTCMRGRSTAKADYAICQAKCK